MDRKKAVMILIFISWIIITALVVMYTGAMRESSREKLTYEKALQMDKEQILEVLKEKKDQPSAYGNYIIIAMAVMGFVLGGITLWIVHTEHRIEGAKEAFLGIFTGDERKVIEILLENGGEEAQVKIRLKTGLNKVKLTRLLKQMEKKGLIEIVKGGKVNFVRFSPRVKRLLEVLRPGFEPGSLA